MQHLDTNLKRANSCTEFRRSMGTQPTCNCSLQIKGPNYYIFEVKVVFSAFFKCCKNTEFTSEFKNTYTFKHKAYF